MVAVQAPRSAEAIDGFWPPRDTAEPVRRTRLELIALDDILLHEDCDPERVNVLASAIAADGLQRHPVVAGWVANRPLVHLDGATRIAALRQLQCRHVAAQVVGYCNDEAVSLETWCHITTLSPAKLLRAAQSWSGCLVEWTDCGTAGARLAEGTLAAVLVFTDGNVFGLRSDASVMDKIEILQRLTDLYGDFTIREIAPENDRLSNVRAALGRHAPANASIAFCSFRKDEVVEVALRAGTLFPPGITRHIINCGRVLHVNVPLALLQSDESVPEKMRQLQMMLAARQERIYREPTVQYEP